MNPSKFAGRYMTVKDAIVRHCSDCLGFAQVNKAAIRQCQDKDCPLWPWRNHPPHAKLNGRTPMTSVRAYCDEVCRPYDDLITCPMNGTQGADQTCPLWPYRMARDQTSGIQRDKWETRKIISKAMRVAKKAKRVKATENDGERDAVDDED